MGEGCMTYRSVLRGCVGFTSLAIAILAVPNMAHAQAAQPQPGATGSEADDAEEVAKKASGITEPLQNQPEEKDAIVVTGTLLRGVVPTGANTTSLNRTDIEATGQASTTQLLAQIPQLSTFNTLPQIGAANGAGTAGLTNRPNARNTAENIQDSAGNTLVLLDGNRMSGVGARQISADVDGIPSILIERVEALLDGGSATYGSDAIGGVLNFITRRRYDGAQVTAHYGFADNYSQWDASAILGTDWGSGGAYVAYAHSENTVLFRSDRDYYRVLNYTTGLETGTSCDAPNITIGSGATARLYAVNPDGTVRLTNGVATPGTANAPVNGNPNLCTLGKQAAMFPEQNRHAVTAVFNQDFADNVRLIVRGRYAYNFARTYDQPFATTVAVRPNNPYFQFLVGTGDLAANQNVSFNYGLAFGEHRPATNQYTQYGINAELAWDISDNWHTRFVANYDRSNSRAFGPDYNASALVRYTQTNAAVVPSPSACSSATALIPTTPGAARDAVLAGPLGVAARAACINPYNFEASNPALLADISNWMVDNGSTDRILQFKAIVDGTLVNLPAGPLKVALGAEYLDNQLNRRAYTGRPDRSLSTIDFNRDGNRNNWSIFGEADIPIVSSSNEMPLIKELRFSAQGRFDHFSNTGGIFNPKFGFSYKPVDWFKLRGNWGKSFRAPSAFDVISRGAMTVSIDSALNPQYNNTVRAADRASLPLDALIVSYNPGSIENLLPQSGTVWSIGGEFTPFPGFFASATYYNLVLKDPFSIPDPVSGAFSDFAVYLQDLPTQAARDAALTEFLNRGGNSTDIRNTLNSTGAPVYVLFDSRLRNLGATRTRGIDYSLRYSSGTSFGSVTFSIAGNIRLGQESQSRPGAVFTDSLLTATRSSLHRFTMTAGFSYHDTLRGQVTWNHTDGYDTVRSATLLQDHVGAFNPVNLFLSYDFKGEDVFRDRLQLTLSVNNILDETPPLFFSNGGIGTANGSTLGRLIQVGFKKEFGGRSRSDEPLPPPAPLAPPPPEPAYVPPPAPQQAPPPPAPAPAAPGERG